MLVDVQTARNLLEGQAQAAERNKQKFISFSSTITIKPWKEKIDDQISKLREEVLALEEELQDYSFIL